MDIEIEGRKYVARDESELIIKLAEHIGEAFIDLIKGECASSDRRNNVIAKTKMEEQDARQNFLRIKAMRSWDELQEFGSVNFFGRIVRRTSEYEPKNPR